MKPKPSLYTQTAIDTTAGGIALSGATTIPSAAWFALVQPQGCDVNWRDDGTAPTTTVGMKLTDGTTLKYDARLASIKVIARSGSGTLNVSYYEGGNVA